MGRAIPPPLLNALLAHYETALTFLQVALSGHCRPRSLIFHVEMPSGLVDWLGDHHSRYKWFTRY